MSDPLTPSTAGEFNPYPKPAIDVPEAVAPLKEVRYLKDMSKLVDLRFPLEWDGVTYEQIKVVSITIAIFRKHLENGGDAATTSLPMFEDVAGNPVPREVLDALAVGDSIAVRGAAEDFLSSGSQGAAT